MENQQIHNIKLTPKIREALGLSPFGIITQIYINQYEKLGEDTFFNISPTITIVTYERITDDQMQTMQT